MVIFRNKPFLITLLVLMFFPLAAGLSAARERKGEVRIRVTVEAPESNIDTRLWIPYPVSDSEQTIADVRIEGNFTEYGVYIEPVTGNRALYAEWTEPAKERSISFAFRAEAVERVKKEFFPPESGSGEVPADVLPYLESTAFIETGGVVRETALEAIGDKTDLHGKARAIYDWVVENTRRDPGVVGCGVGDVEVTLARRGGKCADISTVFVALARAVGVPAREVFGLRLGRKAIEVMTNGHHCWAEFYLPGSGWVPVDPADVLKIMLKKNLTLDEAGVYREYYFGAVDEYRVALGRGGRGYYLNPRQKDGPLNYFMYPYAEVDGKALEWLAAQKALKYTITFEEQE